MTKREVTNEEFRKVYYGDDDDASQKAASDNRGIIRGVTKNFRKILSVDELESCGMVATWRCLQKHDPLIQKFTSSLYRFVRWECLKALGQKKTKAKKNEDMYYLSGLTRHFDCATTDIFDPESVELISHIHECFDQINSDYTKNFIDDYFFKGKTLEQIGFKHGFSKEAARNNVQRAVNCLYENCRAKLKLPIKVYALSGE